MLVFGAKIQIVIWYFFSDFQTLWVSLQTILEFGDTFWTPSQITWEPIWLFPKGANQIMSSDNAKFATLDSTNRLEKKLS